jgi:hypothetical protein
LLFVKFHDKSILSWYGQAGHGAARHGLAWLGKARQGMAAFIPMSAAIKFNETKLRERA